MLCKTLNRARYSLSINNLRCVTTSVDHGRIRCRILCGFAASTAVHRRCAGERCGNLWIQRNDFKETADQAVEIFVVFRSSSTFLIEWITVEWCLPPKLRPISGSDACRERLAQIHRDLARHRHGLRVVARLQLADLQLVVVGDELLNRLDRDRLVVLIDDVSQHFLRELQRDLPSGQRGIGDQADQRSLELADVRLDRPAMYIATLSGSGTASASAFRLRIATFVSRSGGWMSAINPHSKRDRSRSSSAESRAAAGRC